MSYHDGRSGRLRHGRLNLTETVFDSGLTAPIDHKSANRLKSHEGAPRLPHHKVTALKRHPTRTFIKHLLSLKVTGENCPVFDRASIVDSFIPVFMKFVPSLQEKTAFSLAHMCMDAPTKDTVDRAVLKFRLPVPVMSLRSFRARLDRVLSPLIPSAIDYQSITDRCWNTLRNLPEYGKAVSTFHKAAHLIRHFAALAADVSPQQFVSDFKALWQSQLAEDLLIKFNPRLGRNSRKNRVPTLAYRAPQSVIDTDEELATAYQFFDNIGKRPANLDPPSAKRAYDILKSLPPQAEGLFDDFISIIKNAFDNGLFELTMGVIAVFVARSTTGVSNQLATAVGSFFLGRGAAKFALRNYHKIGLWLEEALNLSQSTLNMLVNMLARLIRWAMQYIPSFITDVFQGLKPVERVTLDFAREVDPLPLYIFHRRIVDSYDPEEFESLRDSYLQGRAIPTLKQQCIEDADLYSNYLPPSFKAQFPSDFKFNSTFGLKSVANASRSPGPVIVVDRVNLKYFYAAYLKFGCSSTDRKSVV